MVVITVFLIYFRAIKFYTPGRLFFQLVFILKNGSFFNASIVYEEDQDSY